MSKSNRFPSYYTPVHDRNIVRPFVDFSQPLPIVFPRSLSRSIKSTEPKKTLRFDNGDEADRDDKEEEENGDNRKHNGEDTDFGGEESNQEGDSNQEDDSNEYEEEAETQDDDDGTESENIDDVDAQDPSEEEKNGASDGIVRRFEDSSDGKTGDGCDQDEKNESFNHTTIHQRSWTDSDEQKYLKRSISRFKRRQALELEEYMDRMTRLKRKLGQRANVPDCEQ